MAIPLRFNFFLLFVLCLIYCKAAISQESDTTFIYDSSQAEIVYPESLVSTIPLENFAGLSVKDGNLHIDLESSPMPAQYTLEINGETDTIQQNGLLDIDPGFRGAMYFFKAASDQHAFQHMYHVSKSESGQWRIRHIPLWLSLLPPLLAIIMALVFKEVVVSLFVGIWAGAYIAGGMRLDSFWEIIKSFYAVIDKYIITSLNDSGHISVIVFSILIGGMVAIISKNGGMVGVVNKLSRFASTRKRAQLTTWFLGIAIFFDDYANTLIVGNTMRSLTDKFKISREKLAYIVDSTAAPVSAIAFITTWIGAELGFIDSGIALLDNFNFTETPYSLFIQSLKYSFYPILTLLFVVILIYSGREFGAMAQAEKRAVTTGQVSSARTSDEDEPNMEDLTPVKGATPVWWNAAIPVLAVILMTIVGLVDTGMGAIYDKMIALGNMQSDYSWGFVWSNMSMVADQPIEGFFSKLGYLVGMADSYVALLWASGTGVILAIGITVGKRIMNLFDTMHWMLMGFKTMLPALVILTLAWALALVTDELHTADYITMALQDTISPYLLPGIIFILAALIAFSTGSSWSTMAILYPIAIPASWAIGLANGIDPDANLEILLNVIATVLAASVLGDHCSPISDTTILSSLASDCNHIDHVKTQLPYALFVGGVSLICVVLASWLNWGWLGSLFLIICGLVVFFFGLKFFSRKVRMD